jgi:hypothetical protein
MDEGSSQLTPDLRYRLQNLANKRIDQVRTIQSGYTPAQRLQIAFDDDTTCFAKIGTTPHTAQALRQENQVYQALQGSFLPQYLGWDDHPASPILLLEDFSHAFWPPPWNKTRVNQVLAALSQMWASSLPDVPAMVDMMRIWDGWQQVAENPAPFLALGLATEDWLKQSLAILLELNTAEVVDGRSLLHFDLRSDNICFSQGRAIIIDWNLVCRGNAKVDLGFWLPSLEAEGGPQPEQLLPDAGEIAGLVSGFFAARAGLPTIQNAPRVRHIQLVQLKTALPWAARALDLPPLDGKPAK